MEGRVNREEFKQHGLKEVVTVKHRNVYKDGFDGLEDEVDAGAFAAVPSLASRDGMASCPLS